MLIAPDIKSSFSSLNRTCRLIKEIFRAEKFLKRKTYFKVQENQRLTISLAEFPSINTPRFSSE